MVQSHASVSPAQTSATPMGGDGRIWFPHLLRGIACFIVVLCHLGILFPTGQNTIAMLTMAPPLKDLPQPSYLGVLSALGSPQTYLGSMSVAILFLISGFVIPFSMQSHTRGGFLLRRVFRLYPTLWFIEALVVALLLYHAWFYRLPVPIGLRTIVTNAFLVNTFFGKPFLEVVCWSMVVEEMFYLICTAGGWRLATSRSAILATAVALAAVTLWIGPVPAPANGSPIRVCAAYWLGNFIPYVIFVFIGVVFHHYYRGRWRLGGCGLMTVALLGIYNLALLGSSIPPAKTALFLIASPLAIAVFLALLFLAARVPYSRMLDHLGEISYPMYLIHATCGYAAMRGVYLLVGNVTAALLITVVLVLIVASLIHRWIEQPTNEWGRRVVKRLGLRIKSGAGDRDKASIPHGKPGIAA